MSGRLDSEYTQPGARSSEWLWGRLCAALIGAALGCGEAPDWTAEGAALYRVYCVSCHGETGRGDGPVAASLVPPPADLTGLSERNGGAFPETNVLATIDGRYEVAAHGPREMPVWGAVFLEKHVGEPLAIHRGMDDARALADYLRTLQRPPP